jgi:hypothetical protein
MKKRKYEPPTCIDIGSIGTAAGQTNPYDPKPNCGCYSGCTDHPANCTTGLTPASGTCQSGGHPSGYCHVGSAANYH